MESFDCGNQQLNSYLKRQAGQDVKRKLAACFVLTSKDSANIIGFYTLSNNSIPLTLFPEDIRRKLPPSSLTLPTTLLGRLAVDSSFAGKGAGKILLIDALKRSYELSKEIGSFAVVVDPIDSAAEKFYQKFDFVKLPDSGRMIIPIKTLQSLFQADSSW